MVNHTNQTKEVFVQDENNTIYLIGSTGTVLWQRQLTEKVMAMCSKLTFTTTADCNYSSVLEARFTYWIASEEMFTGWPVTLPAPASNEVIALDYDKTKNYRILVACMDNQLYNFDKTGKRVEGWEFAGSAARITAKVQHFVVNNKDYIYAADLAGNHSPPR